MSKVRLLAVGCVAGLLVAAPNAFAGIVLVDGNNVNELAIVPGSVGDGFSGELADGDLVFYADPAYGALGYYEDLYALSVTETTAVDILITAEPTANTWIDLFRLDPVSGEYLYVASDDNWDGQAYLGGTIEPGRYLVGVSSVNELEAFSYVLAIAPYEGTDPQPLDAWFGDCGCTCEGDLCSCQLCAYAMYSMPAFTVSNHSSSRANAVVGFLRSTEKRHNGRYVGAQIRQLLGLSLP